MRIKIEFNKNIESVPVNNQHMLNSYIHKCLGINNKYHDTPSNYNISHLYGGNLVDENLVFNDGGYIVVSSMDQEFVNKLLIGVLNNQELFCGMTFAGVNHIQEEFFDGWNHFATLSPFIVEEKTGERKNRFLTLDENDFEERLENYLVNKLSKVNPDLDLLDFKVVVPNNSSHKVKTVFVGTRMNKANQCHVSIFTNKKVAETLYNIGLGKSTGSGFGCIYKTENHRLYKKHTRNSKSEIKKSKELAA
jgi:CRISPR-associated endoribonuclease Cas6